jgi:hypothetical protein
MSHKTVARSTRVRSRQSRRVLAQFSEKTILLQNGQNGQEYFFVEKFAFGY